jgi:hypothetical protein
MIRWCTQGLHTTMTLAALMTPGAKPGVVTVQRVRGNLVVTVRAAGLNRRLVVSRRLHQMSFPAGIEERSDSECAGIGEGACSVRQ